MTKTSVFYPSKLPERWITQIENGVVTLVQRINADAFVISSCDLPAFCANREFVSDAEALQIIMAIKER